MPAERGLSRPFQMGLSSYQDILKKGRGPQNPEYSAQVRRVGTRIAKVTAQAARDLWVRMASEGGARQPELLSTHPLPQTRIAQIDAWLPEARQYYTPR